MSLVAVVVSVAEWVSWRVVVGGWGEVGGPTLAVALPLARPTLAVALPSARPTLAVALPSARPIGTNLTG